MAVLKKLAQPFFEISVVRTLIDDRFYMKSRLLFVVSLLCGVIVSLAEIPAGYYDEAIGKKDAQLKAAMHRIIAPHTRISYGADGTWVVFRTSDVRADGSIWDMYSDVVRYFPATGSHSEMHIEHSVPKSWWGEESTFVYEASFDIHHLVPSDASANMSKSNNILGEVTTVTFDNGVSKVGKVTLDGKTLSAFEPADEYKGDFARMYMYVATCYQEYEWESDGVYMFNSEAYPTLNAYARDLLMRWHRNDPVSEKEKDRNEAVYLAQSNRNPFIDFPLLAEYLWGDSIGKTFDEQLSEQPYLVEPSRDDKIDMGAVMIGTTLTYDLIVSGRNISTPVQFAWKNNVGILLSSSELSAQSVNEGAMITLSYTNEDLAGVLRDTLIIEGGISNKMELPVEVRGTTSFIPLSPIYVDATSATLRWVALPNAQSYRVELYEGASEATDLFISAYVEGSSYNKAIALYNGTSRAINLGDYALGRQHNGMGEYVDYWPLPDKTLPAGSTFILVNSQCTNDELRDYADAFVPAGEASPLNFNGNDAVALYHNNILIDVVGEFSMIDNWGKDVTMYRSNTTLGPTTMYDVAQWTMAERDDFALLRSHTIEGITAQPVLINTKEVDETSVEVVDLHPSTTYVYKVQANVNGGKQEGLYPCAFSTKVLSAPTDVLVEKVHSEGFTLYWNEVNGAVGYEVDCFRLEGDGSVTVTESFDDVGSKGTPLPNGWSGTASGNYTSAASSGNAIPSIGLKSDGEYIQTPTFDAITEISFMYRFASAAVGSSLVVSYMKDGVWSNFEKIDYVNTTKTTCTYSFEPDENVQAFRFTYNKVSGNLAIDDVVITYGSLDTMYVANEQFVDNTTYVAHSLQSPETYYYRVRAVNGNARSLWSAVGAVTTDPSITGVRSVEHNTVAYAVDANGLVLYDIEDNSVVEVYNIQGVLCERLANVSGYIHIPLREKGVYLIRITNNNKNYSLKVLR